MLVDLKPDTLELFTHSANNNAFRYYCNNQFQLRNCLKSFMVNKGISTYSSFLSLIKHVAPYEDEEQVYRFWNGYYFSEYFNDFMMDLTDKLSYINISLFQDEVVNKCGFCGSSIIVKK